MNKKNCCLVHASASDQKKDLYEKDRFEINLSLIELSRKRDQNLVAPINLDFKLANIVELPPLEWNNHNQVPTNLRLSNSGKTVIVSGKWSTQTHPYLSGGPLKGNYIFSQAHFFWGKNANSGTVHSIDGEHLALEIHNIYFNELYRSQERARTYPDGIVIVVYLYEIRFRMNSALEPITLSLEKIRSPNTSIFIPSLEFSKLFKSFNQYFTYFGILKSKYYKCKHSVQWIISRNLLPISYYQLKKFEQLVSIKLLPLVQTWRRVPDHNLLPQLFLVKEANENIVTSWLPVKLNENTVQ